MVRTVIVLIGLLPVSGALDVVTFERMVEILKVQATPLPGPARRHSVEVTFNLPPDFPKGIRVEFELQRQGLRVGDPFPFVLQNEVRKNIRFAVKPKERLTSDRYLFTVQIPLADQVPEVRQFIEGKPARFPPKEQPWTLAYPEQEFTVGTPEDAASEQNEFKEWAEGTAEKILDLNDKGVEELEKHKSGKPDQEALKKLLTGWSEEMATVQKEIVSYIDREPGLYFRFQRIHTELLELSRMVSKRITRTDLGAILKKVNLTPSALKLTPVAGFDPNFRFRASAADVQARYEKIHELLDPDAGTSLEGADGESAPGDAEKAAGKEGKAEGSEKTSVEPEAEEGAVKDQPKPEDPPPEGKKGKKTPKPKGAKKTEKKSSPKKDQAKTSE